MPWRQAWKLIRKRSDFASFQWTFMICGFALMVIMPAIPIFCVDFLKVTYTDLAIAIGVCKGVGFAISSQRWARTLSRYGIFHTVALVCVFFAIFPLLLVLSQWGIGWFYASYLIYGIAQGGSHLCWHMSGPVFAQDEDSSLYSSVNVVMVGLRGCVGPLLGGLLCVWFGPVVVLPLGAAFSIFAAARTWHYEKKTIVLEN